MYGVSPYCEIQISHGQLSENQLFAQGAQRTIDIEIPGSIPVLLTTNCMEHDGI